MSEITEQRDKFALPLGNIELSLAALDSILAKGGSCSIDVLVTTMGKSAGTVYHALATCSELGFVVPAEGNAYKLTDLGSKLASSNEQEQKKIVRECLLKYEPYNTILLRIKNSKDKTIQKSEITKAWYDLQKSGTESTRDKNTTAFVSMAAWCGLIDSGKQTVTLLGDLVNPPQQPQTVTTGAKGSTDVEPPSKSTNPSLAGLANVSIQISVDAKDETSVQNVIRILKALRGEHVD